MTFRLWLIVIVSGLILGLAGGLWLLSDQLKVARIQRDAAVAELNQAYNAMAVMAAERVAYELRQEIVREEREAILSVDPADDAPMAPVLRQALDAADRIGGLK